MKSLLLTLAATTAMADSTVRFERVKKIAETCAACHGRQGISENDEWPNLAGQKERYLYLQLVAYKKGDRKNPLMSPMVSDLSDQDMKDLAHYYSQLGKAKNESK
ncbi:MAG: cytochrome c [Bdellovibrionales bacterium]